MKRIVVVEDDKGVREELATLLANSGYQVVLLTDFAKLKTELEESDADLILLDINIPILNGVEILKEFRRKVDTPVIMVTSRDGEADEVLAMSYGADDYVVKPYNPTVLLLRIAAVLKRTEAKSGDLRYEDLTLDLAKGRVSGADKEVDLSKNEMLIFSYLVEHRGEMVKRSDLMILLWNNSEYINDNALTVNVSRLRMKLKELGYDEAIETKKKYGYILR